MVEICFVKKIYSRGDSVSIENRKYYCDTTCPHRTKECKNICIRAEKLYKIVLDDINKYANAFATIKENYSILEQKLEEITSQNTKNL